MSELLESVKRLAGRMPIIKTCKPQPIGRRQDGPQFARPQDYEEHDMVALAKHLARLERVEVAVRKAKHYLEHRTTCKYLWDGVECDCGYIAASAALDAALSENPDAE